jgi:hypothetical protein
VGIYCWAYQLVLGCLFSKFLPASYWYLNFSKTFIPACYWYWILKKNFHTRLVLIWGPKRAIFGWSSKIKYPVLIHNHVSHSFRKSNNCPETTSSLLMLSWGLPVLGGL